MLIQELIHILMTYHPHAKVHFMTQRANPYENHVAGVVGRTEMADQIDRVAPGIDAGDVFLVVGKQIRPGSPMAWGCAEEKQRRLMQASAPEARVLSALAQQLGVEAADGTVPFAAQTLKPTDVRDALLAAYRSGLENRPTDTMREDASQGAIVRADGIAATNGDEVV